MGNLLTGIKRFLSNKNTVTIICILVGVAVLYVGYNWRVNQATSPVKIPYAKQEITSRTKITADMIGYTEVPSSLVSSSKNIISNVGAIIDKYVSYGATIPENSFFYFTLVMDQSEMPDSTFADIPDGYTIFPLKVNMDTTYGNSIFPGNKIDLYVETKVDGKVMFGRLIQSIEVLAVKDNQGQHVFESTTEARTPSVMLFAVPDDIFELLEKAEALNLTIKPIPRNSSYTQNPGDTVVDKKEIEDYINANSVPLS